MGWIGFFSGRTKLRIRATFGLSFTHRGIAILTPEGASDPVIHVTAREFYERMDGLVAAIDWRRDAVKCAEALRAYAHRYHRVEALVHATLEFRSKVVPTDRGRSGVELAASSTKFA